MSDVYSFAVVGLQQWLNDLLDVWEHAFATPVFWCVRGVFEIFFKNVLECLGSMGKVPHFCIRFWTEGLGLGIEKGELTDCG